MTAKEASFKFDQGTRLLLDEYFDSEDARFLSVLRSFAQPASLAAFADKWKKDPRPWAREQMFAYLREPFSVPGHQPLVRRLFKHAEENRDDELMAHFLAALDCLVRRYRKKFSRYDWTIRQITEGETLVLPRNSFPKIRKIKRVNPMNGRTEEFPAPVPKNALLFSYHTRHYLRRRSWRYFRRLGYQRPDAYPEALARALRLYEDEDLASGENILDSWGLANALFRRDANLEFRLPHVNLNEEADLANLSAAPCFPELWARRESLPILEDLALRAPARLVRIWAVQVMRQSHMQNLSSLDLPSLFKLFEAPDDETQQLAAEAFGKRADLGKLDIATWLSLFSIRNTTALTLVFESMPVHVNPERLSLNDCLRMAAARPAPVARLGLDFLKARRLESLADKQALSLLADAQCSAFSSEIATWALSVLGKPDVYDADIVIRFLDSLQPDIREAAWAIISAEGCPGHDDPKLWMRLLETPYDDLRFHLLEHLDRKSRLPGANAGDLLPLWASVLLNVHRGGRQKLRALRQAGNALQNMPERGEDIIPILSVAIRSVRPSEVREGLGAILGALQVRPELENLARHHLPELNLAPAEAQPWK